MLPSTPGSLPIPASAARFQDRVVLVTGASGALGGAVATAFVAQGAVLVAADRNVERLDSAFGGMAPERVLKLGADLADPASVAGMVAAIEARFGRLDAVAHCAGGFRGGDPLWKTSVEDFDAMWSSNARSTFLLVRAAAAFMARVDRRPEEAGGAIVVVASGAALRGGAGMSSYAASKAAALRLVESLAADADAHGLDLRVNAVLPGTMDTPANRRDMPAADRSGWTPLDAVVEAILFLCSEESRAVQGAAMDVSARPRAQAGRGDRVH